MDVHAMAKAAGLEIQMPRRPVSLSGHEEHLCSAEWTTEGESGESHFPGFGSQSE